MNQVLPAGFSTRGNNLHIIVGGQNTAGSPIRITAVNTLGEGILRDPWGLCVTKDELSIVVSDQCKVYIFDLNGQNFKTISGFDFACGVTEDSEGKILVVDCFKHQILKYSKDGELNEIVGREGSGPLEFSYPKGITHNPDNGRFYVADFNNHRIQVLNPDLTYHSSFGSYGSGPGQFKHPSAITSDMWGNIFVAGHGNRRIQAFTADGVSIRTWEECTVELLRPDGIIVNYKGEVCISEPHCNCITKLDSEGRFMESFKTSGRESYLKEPCGLALIKGMLLFCDNGSPKCIRCLPGVC